MAIFLVKKNGQTTILDLTRLTMRTKVGSRMIYCKFQFQFLNGLMHNGEVAKKRGENKVRAAKIICLVNKSGNPNELLKFGFFRLVFRPYCTNLNYKT